MNLRTSVQGKSSSKIGLRTQADCNRREFEGWVVLSKEVVVKIECLKVVHWTTEIVQCWAATRLIFLDIM